MERQLLLSVLQVPQPQANGALALLSTLRARRLRKSKFCLFACHRQRGKDGFSHTLFIVGLN